jgi:methyl-accepting chemotaxis protein
MATAEGAGKVESGARFAQEAGESLNRALSAIRGAADGIDDIAVTTGDQSAGLAKVAASMAQVNQALREAALSMTQTQECSVALMEIGQSLKAMSDQYRL